MVKGYGTLLIVVLLAGCFDSGPGAGSLPAPTSRAPSFAFVAAAPWTMWHMNNTRNPVVLGISGAITTPVVKWKTQMFGLAEGSCAIADVEGNGEVAVIASGYKGVKAMRGKTGEVIWEFPTTGDFNLSTPAIADLNGDGKLEAVFGDNKPTKKIYCVDAKTGALKWQVDTGGDVWSSAAIADLNGDGKLEVIISSDSDSLYAIRSDGSILWKANIGFSAYSSPAVADLDGDGKLEVISPGGFNQLIVFNGQTGAQKYSATFPAAIESTPVIVDVDQDGKLDIVFTIDGYGIYAVRGDNLQTKWFFPFEGSETLGIISSCAVADLDGDGKLEVVSGSADHNLYCVRGDTGALKWKFNNGGTQTYQGFESSPSIADIDGDGTLDVLIGAHTGYVYAVDGKTGALKWKFFAGGGESKVVSTPTPVDIDGDGKLELIFGSNNGDFWCLHGPGNNPPVVSITAPTSGSTVTGTITIKATAQDDNGVTSVKFMVDGAQIANDTAAPFEATWDSTTVSNGSHQISAVATNTTNLTAQASVSVTVQNGGVTAPTVSITQPTNGSTVNGTVQIKATASPNVVKVDFSIDGTLLLSATSSPFAATWNTATYAAGSHTLTATASTASNQTATSTVSVTVATSTDTPPTVSITQPAAGAVVQGTVTIIANATDDVGVASVTFFIDGTQLAQDTQAPYSASWTTSSSGTHTIKAVAKDTAGQTTEASITVSVPNQTAGLVGPWPLWRGDIRNTATAPAPGALSSPILKYAAVCGLGESTPVVGDIDGDGKLEIVTFLYSGDLRVFDAKTGTLKWEKKIAPNGIQIASPTLADLDGDGKVEILIASISDQLLYVLRGTDGSTKWTFNLGGQPMATPVVADLLGDGKVEIIAHGGNILYALKSDGTILWQNSSVTPSTHSSAAVGDVDGDGKIDVVIGTWTGIACLNGATGQTKWTFDMPGGGQSTPVIADLNGDGKLEVVAVSPEGGIFAINGANGTQKWNFKWPSTTMGWMNSPAVGDLNGDGIKDVVAGSGQPDHTIYAVNGANGQQIWKYTVGTWLEPSPLIWDADGDGKPEVIYRAYDGVLYMFAGATGQVKWSYTFTDKAGNVACSPVPVDVDGDGIPELLVQESNGKLHLFGSNVTPPSVSITNPANGATVSGTITIAATATSSSTISKVEFFVDNVSLSIDTSSPYQATWNTSQVANGSHQIKATATAANGTTAFATITVQVQNNAPPQVSITQPANNATVSGTITLKANATDAGSVTSVKFFIGTTLLVEDTTAPYQATWNTTTVANGTYQIKAEAKDNLGLTASAQITVTVSNGTDTPPTVSITQPSGGATVSGTVSIKANASDNVGVVEVKFLVDGATLSTVTTAPYQASWNTTTATNGAHTLTAIAKDTAGQTSQAQVTVQVQNATANQPPVIAPIGNKTVKAGQVLTFTVTASDPQGAPVTLTASGIPQNATFDPQTGKFTFSPSINQAGTYTLTFQASDGSLTSTQTITITVTPVQTSVQEFVAQANQTATATEDSNAFYANPSAIYSGSTTTGTKNLGVVMFDLSSLPSDAAIVKVEFLITGKDSTWLLNPEYTWNVNLVDETLATTWAQLKYATVQQAAIRGSLTPTLKLSDVGENKVNTLALNDAGLNALKQLAPASRRAVIRVEGPVTPAYSTYSWYPGGADDTRKPRLRVTIAQ